MKVKEQIQELYCNHYRINCIDFYGPYKRKRDGRRIVRLRGRGINTTKLYAKAKLEVKLGRILKSTETVDHIDGNALNDNFDNLQLLSRKANAQKSALKVKPLKVKCVWCDKPFLLRRDQRGNKTNAGPFCSRSCTGKYGASIQKDKSKRIKRVISNLTYYR